MMNKNERDHKIIKGTLCAIGCETMFGMSFSFTKNALECSSTIELLGWRFLIAAIGIGICAALGLIKLDFKSKPVKPVLLISLLYPCIYFLLETFGISNTTASESGVIIGCIPIGGMIASTLLLHKKPTRFQMVGVLITLAGVCMTVVAVGAKTEFSVVGYASLITAIAVYSIYTVFVEKSTQYSGEEITFLMLMVAAAFYFVVAMSDALIHGTVHHLVTLPFEHVGFLVAILYAGICSSVIAFFLGNVALGTLGVNATAAFVGLSTVVSIIAGVVALGEEFTGWQIIGTIVILAGVYVANNGYK